MGLKEKTSALLVYDQEDPLGRLIGPLETQSIETCRARTCQQALPILEKGNPPHLVFTDTTLPDGTWADVLALAAGARAPVSVIVVARLPDVRLYVEVIQRGAFDFISPPFVASELAHILRCVTDNVFTRREAQARANV